MKKKPNQGTIRARVRKAGLKATPPRLLVFSILQKSNTPLSAQHIVEQVKRRADQATVYRVLHDFKARGIIRPVDLRHNHAHYELAEARDHHHIVCLRCGRIEDIEECGAEEVQSRALKSSRHFLEIKQHSLEFYGVCRTCAHKKSRGDANECVS